jgi:hypothetical protein
MFVVTNYLIDGRTTKYCSLASTNYYLSWGALEYGIERSARSAACFGAKRLSYVHDRQPPFPRRLGLGRHIERLRREPCYRSDIRLQLGVIISL